MTNWDLQIELAEKRNEEKLLKQYPWKEYLLRDTKGKIENRIENYLLYFTESDKYKGKLKYNEFLQQKEFNGEIWNDFDEDQACIDVEMETGLSSDAKAKRAINGIFGANRYNPVQDYLKRLKWDGQKRIETIFVKCFNVEDSNLVRTLSKKWFIAAVKRVFEPGCQFDNMIVLQGPTGIGKTTFCRLLSNNFYSELKFDEISGKDIVDKLNKSWIAIIDEMDNFEKKEMGSIKSFLSIRKDLVRLAYARNTNIYQRHCIFIGSLNNETFLRDTTTNVERRFWVFKCNREGMDSYVSDILTQDMVDQLWAEAMHYYTEDPYQYLDVDFDMQKEFAEDQKKYKKYNDDNVIKYVTDILEREYVLVNGKFNDDNDFLNQFTSHTLYDTVMKSKLDRISIASLSFVLKKVYGETRSGRYLGNAIDGWKYSTVKVNGIPVPGLVRVCEHEEEEK